MAAGCIACSATRSTLAKVGFLACFHAISRPSIPAALFSNVVLHYSDEVTHLGHIITSDLNDRSDIIRAVKELNHTLFWLFHAVDPFVKSSF